MFASNLYNPHPRKKNMIYKKTKIAFSILATGLAVTACGEKAPHNLVTASQNEARAPALTENWRSNCVKSSLFDVSMLVEYEFAGDAFIERYRYFSESDCRNDSEAANIRYLGRFEVLAAVEPGGIDMRYEEAKIQIKNETGRKIVDAVDFCGREEWAIGDEMDLTNAARGVTCPIKSVQQGRFDLFKVENKTLYFGTGYLEGDAENPADRPRNLKMDQPFREVE